MPLACNITDQFRTNVGLKVCVFGQEERERERPENLAHPCAFTSLFQQCTHKKLSERSSSISQGRRAHTAAGVCPVPPEHTMLPPISEALGIIDVAFVNNDG